MKKAMILGLNHITIAVSDLERSIRFYRDTLGFAAHAKWALLLNSERRHACPMCLTLKQYTEFQAYLTP